MIRILSVIFTIVVTSFYFFPFEFTFLPGVNTKMAMAGLGLVILGIQLGKSRDSLIGKDFFVLSMFALAVSLISYIAVSLNDTYDYTYVSYVISMWVWLGGAYVVISLIRKVHNVASVEVVCHYLIAVCVAQCAIAMLMDSLPPVKAFVDSFLGGTEGYMGKNESRLYGIGAALDVAGTRFSAALVMIAYLMAKNNEDGYKFRRLLYIISFLIIAIVGNMMARTTTLGVILSLLYWVYVSEIYKLNMSSKYTYIWRWFLGAIIVGLPALVYLYLYNQNFYENIRFGFEGFFSLAETGKWQVSSNDILKNMYVFPDNFKTWVIGDGYIVNPKDDPYYTGPIFGGYYMGTDVGYLRFIFYFGLTGLIAFISYIYKSANICIQRFGRWKDLFVLFLLINFVVWFKVATDIFLVFAIFLCVNKDENEQYDTLVESKA